jgi:hypothetical protein
MKKKMRKNFLSFGYSQTLYQRLHMLKQEGKVVNDYTNEFYQLVFRNDLVETVEQLVVRYLSGLHQSIQDILCLQVLWIVFYVNLFRVYCVSRPCRQFFRLIRGL